MLLIAVVGTDPWRIDRQSRISRIASLLLTSLIIVTNLVALAQLVRGLITGADADGGQLLVAGLQVWATNVIAFGLLYWELDRGGPVARVESQRERLPRADFRFTQDETQDTVDRGGGRFQQAIRLDPDLRRLPVPVDHQLQCLQPDRHDAAHQPRAKVLMGLQATAALLTSLLVIARAVGALA